MGRYVGIDLGTTFSAVCYIDQQGRPVMCKNREGEVLTPSAILFENGKPVIGRTAREKSTVDPRNFEAFVKRHMGDKTYSFTTRDGETYGPEELSAMILAKLKKDAELWMKDTIDGAVITVPAYFTDAQRQSVKDAARMAGIPVLGIINEPTAAALAYGVKYTGTGRQRLLIYDLGGGTFDVTVLELDRDQMRVIASNGDHKLGGCDIDQALADYVKEDMEDSGLDPESDPAAWQELMLQAERAKIALSAADSARICLTVGGIPYETTVDRQLLEDLTEDLLDTTLSLLEKTLDDVNLSCRDLHQILLVGGSSRIPAVRRLLEEETGITPSIGIDPDQAVAMGAAFHAAQLAKQGVMTKKAAASPTPLQKPTANLGPAFQDVTSHGIGIVAYSTKRRQNFNAVLIPKNTPLPAQVVKDGFHTMKPYQDAIRLTITQGERKDLTYSTVIGQVDMRIRPRAETVPLRCIVSCDRNGQIHVQAVDLEENRDLGEFTIDRSCGNLTTEQVKQARGRIHKLDIGD